MSDSETREGELLWTPSAERARATRMASYIAWLERERGLTFRDYAELHAFSTEDAAGFWRSIWDYFATVAHAAPGRVLRGKMPDAHWFEGATLNYAEHALRRRDEHTALVFRCESGERSELSYRELCEQVGRARAGLVRLGIGAGDRVAALLPNRPEAVIAFLATASLGAVWSSCSPEFGTASVLDRFRQIEPALLLAVEGYTYGGKVFDRSAELRQIRDGLPTLRAAVCLERAGDGFSSWQDLTSESQPLAFTPVPFEHPLWILYSSGTTGLPKAIVHGHGGILLEHQKALALHCDIGADDRFLWFTTTGWMMWNFLVSGLLLEATVVLYDGSPAFPDLNALWKLAEDERVSYFGTSAPYLLACKKAGLEPSRHHDLSTLRALGTTGAPLPADGFAWVYAHVGRELLLGSISGGTDVCTAFVLSCPLLPVRAGEIQCAGLGAKVEAFDERGQPLSNEVGELVLTEPLPSMPVCFWNDANDARRLDSYFSTYPGVWRHGDWIKRTDADGFVIYGRSDSTLNRGGVRMGTSEFYGVVEALPEVEDSLVVDTGSLSDSSGKLWLFVVLRAGFTLDDDLRRRLKQVIRSSLSPRHVPDEIRAVRHVPRTLNGKKLEVPVKKILLGTKAASAASPGTLAEPSALEPFVALARELGTSRE
jgi:acetoacetyl-CoA synthetase